MSKEGFPHAVTLSSILREEGTRHEVVVEDLMGISLAYGWRPVYMRLDWFVRPIRESRWQDAECLSNRLASATPWAEHIVRIELSPAGYRTRPERTQT